MMTGFTNCSSKWLPIFILKVVCLITYQYNINNDIHIPFWVFSDIFFWGGGNSGFFGGIPGRKLSYTHQQETLCRNSNREREWIVIFIFNKSARIWRPCACLESIVHNTYNDTSTVGGRGGERSRKRSSGKPLKFGSEVLCYFMPVSVQPTKVHSRFLPLYMLLY
jgi:hypothetical protein